ncbi:MAG: HAMP domain-containing sensor histidine kinase [Candidatus Nanoarchaeia archaeon]|nr:HAMP domain-containing sensor histidine kinase [Candidatus Nanoarchaeia archaeon]
MELEKRLENIIDLNKIYIECYFKNTQDFKTTYGNYDLLSEEKILNFDYKKDEMICKIYIRDESLNVEVILKELENFCNENVLEDIKEKIVLFEQINILIEDEKIEKNIIIIFNLLNKLIKYDMIEITLKEDDNIIKNFKEKNKECNKSILTNYTKKDLEFESIISCYIDYKPNYYEKIFLSNIFDKINSKFISKSIIEKLNFKSGIFLKIQKFHKHIGKQRQTLEELLDVIDNFGKIIDHKMDIGIFINNSIFINHRTKKKEILDLNFHNEDILFEGNYIYTKLHINERLTYLLIIERKTSFIFKDVFEEEKIILEEILKNTYLSQSLRNLTDINKAKVNILNSLYELNRDFNQNNKKDHNDFVERLNKVLSYSYEYETLTFVDIYHNHIVKSSIKQNKIKKEKIRLSKMELDRLQQYPDFHSMKLKSLIFNIDRFKIIIPIKYKNEMISIIILSSKFKKVIVNIDKRIESIFLNNLSSLIHSNNSNIKLKNTNLILKEMVEEQNKENKELLNQYQAKSDFLSIMLSNIPQSIIVFDINESKNNKLIMFNQKAIKNFTILPEMSFEKFKEKNGFKEEIKNDAEIFSEKLNNYFKIYEEKLTGKYLKNYMGEEKYYEGLNIILFENITKFKELDNLKSDFISNISHEFRTPLTSISGYTNLILMNKFGEVSEKQKEALSVVASESKRLSQLINDVLDISKLESGKIEINKNDVNLFNLSTNIKEVLKGYAGENKINLINEIKQDTIIYCDENKIQQVLINLVDNAIKYNNKNGWVKIKHQQDKENDYIIVEDNGIGISQENVDHLFDKFYQIESIMFKSKKGTGLGLSIVKQIVELHEGNISVESKLGKGTRFIVRLNKKV